MKSKVLKLVVLGGMFLLVMVPALATFKLSNVNYYGIKRSIKPIVNTAENHEIYKLLENSRGKDIFLAVNHPYELAWMAYYGRNNNLYFLNNVLCDLDISGLPGVQKFISANSIPDNVEIINGIISFPRIDKSMSMFGYTDGSVEGWNSDIWSWINKEMKVYLFTKEKTKVSMSFKAIAGPANSNHNRIIKIKNITTKKEYVFNFKDSLTEEGLSIDLEKGKNDLVFEVVEPTKVEYIPANDSRVFMVAIHNLTINPVNRQN